jgi:hypothetical protein
VPRVAEARSAALERALGADGGAPVTSAIGLSEEVLPRAGGSSSPRAGHTALEFRQAHSGRRRRRAGKGSLYAPLGLSILSSLRVAWRLLAVRSSPAPGRRKRWWWACLVHERSRFASPLP